MFSQKIRNGQGIPFLAESFYVIQLDSPARPPPPAPRPPAGPPGPVPPPPPPSPPPPILQPIFDIGGCYRTTRTQGGGVCNGVLLKSDKIVYNSIKSAEGLFQAQCRIRGYFKLGPH